MKKVLKWTGIILAGMIGVLIIGVVGLSIYATVKYKPTYSDRPLYPITADTSPAGIARGAYLMEDAMSCTEACHSFGGKRLAGGAETISEGPVRFVFAVPNLTPDQETGLGSWTDAEIARAIREGIDRDGVAMIAMPSYSYHALSDADAAAVVGYLRSLEPDRNEVPPIGGNIVAKIMLALGLFGPDPVGEPITEARLNPEPGTIENGKYMVALGECMGCHKQNLAGGALPMMQVVRGVKLYVAAGDEVAARTVLDAIDAAPPLEDLPSDDPPPGDPGSIAG